MRWERRRQESQPGGPAAVQKSSPHLTIEIRGPEQEPVLLVSLVNGGDAAITVDRELVILLGVCVVGRDGSDVELEAVPAEDRDRERYRARDRFVELAPGQVLTRRLTLRKGFLCFEYGVGSSFSPDGAIHHDRTTAYETCYRLPPGFDMRNARAVSVTYGRGWGFPEAFRGYTGVDSSEVGLFAEPLRADIDVSARPLR